jgi:hypothetical protein
VYTIAYSSVVESEAATDMSSTSQHPLISEASLQMLNDLSAETGQPVSAILEAALESYRRDLFYAEVAAKWPAVEADLLEEYAAFEGAIADGLESEKW